MPVEAFNNGQSGPSNWQFNDVAHQQGQGQTHGGVPGPNSDPVGADGETGSEALTGSAPQEGFYDETSDNGGTDNFAPPADQDVEVVESGTSTEPVGAAAPRKSDIDLDDEGDDDASDAVEDVDGDGI